MKTLLRRTFVLFFTFSFAVSAFATAVDFADPTRPMFGADSSLWSTLLSALGLG